MNRQHSRVVGGAGVLCFAGVMALWLAASGERATADVEKAAVAKTLTQAVSTPLAFERSAVSKVSFEASDEVVQRLGAYLNVETGDPRGVRVHLTSPSGTKVLVVDGTTSEALIEGGIEGWFGTEGLAPAESLAAFAGEPVNGEWHLSVDGNVAAKLVKWSLTAEVGSSASLAGMETYGEYGGGGCDCRVANRREGAGRLAAGVCLLLGLVLVGRRMSR